MMAKIMRCVVVQGVWEGNWCEEKDLESDLGTIGKQEE